MTGFPRPLLLAMLLCLEGGAGQVFAPAARAQTPGDEGDILNFDEEQADTTAAEADSLEGGAGRPRRRAEADSTGSERLLKTLHPSYDTNYDVNRQTTTWTQGFEFGTKLGIVTFENTTNFNVRTDSGRDETRRDGSNVTNLRFLDIPLNVALDLRRAASERPGDRRQNDDLRLNLTTRDLRKKLFAVDHRVTLGGGLSYRTDETNLSTGRSKSFDSGIQSDASWKGTWDPGSFVTLDGDARWSRTQKNSRLERDTLTVSEPTANQNRGFGLRVRVDPWTWSAANLGVSSNLTDDEAYSPVPAKPGQQASKELERRSSRRQAYTLHFDVLKNVKGTNLTFDVGKNVQELENSLRRDFAYTGDQFNWKGNVKADWLGTDVDLTLSKDRDELDRLTSAGTDTRNNVFEGKLAKKFSDKFQARFNWLVRAKQIFFFDVGPTEQALDRDELRTKLQPAVSYRPNKKWTINAAYIRSTSRRVEINPRQALQSQEEEDFTVDMGITYQLNDATRVSQVYSIKAIYTTFDYSPRSDRLLATQRITTGLDTRIGPKCDLTFEHRFTLQDSGPFRFDADGTRVFERDQRKYRQELTTTIRYQLTSWASALMNSQFLRTDDKNEFVDRTSVSRNLYLQTGLEVSKTLQGSVQVRASGQYVQSNVQDAYWSITSGLTKDF